MMRVTAQRGRVGKIPYGYRVAEDGVRLELETREQEVIASVRLMRSFGLTLRAIAASLEQRGMRNRKGRPFSLSAIHNMTR